VVSGAGRALGGLSVGFLRLLWVRPASTALLVAVAVVVEETDANSRTPPTRRAC